MLLLLSFALKYVQMVFNTKKYHSSYYSRNQYHNYNLLLIYFSKSLMASVSIIGRTFVVEKPAIDTTGQVMSELTGIRL